MCLNKMSLEDKEGEEISYEEPAKHTLIISKSEYYVPVLPYTGLGLLCVYIVFNRVYTYLLL